MKHLSFKLLVHAGCQFKWAIRIAQWYVDKSLINLQGKISKVDIIPWPMVKAGYHDTEV